MEDKEFEEFYSLCDREVRRQRLLGADDIQIAYLLAGMEAAHFEDISAEQEKKLWSFITQKEEKKEQTAVPVVYTAAEFKEELQAARNALKDIDRYLNDEERSRAKCMQIIGWVTSPSSKLYTPSQLREMFDLAYED